MTRNSIALLATGDEIIAGDIVNTNAQRIANFLFHEQMFISQHQSVRDNEEQITGAILALLRNNDAVIITGGLGPTTDDLTRFALAKAVQQPLVFDESTWQAILDRFMQRYGMRDIPSSNRQQALFPSGAEIFPNPYGTAAGCVFRYKEKFIFMLPGPPHECLPMFNDYVLPILRAAEFSHDMNFKNWLLFGVSEAYIAEQLELVLAGLNCQTGYRIAFPYLEFKLFADNPESLTKGVKAAQPIVSPYLFNDTSQKASDVLKNFLEEAKPSISIIDTATGGCLEQLLRTPALNKHIEFHSQNHENSLELSGLDAYWNNNTELKEISFFIRIVVSGKTIFEETKTIINFKERSTIYASEYTCHMLHQKLQS